ncbi:MAG: metallophosphoesterase [Prevotellaceae bacterium]|jgi:predicted MPP superfamily phosphohydrolase|nr:metallophosphoesterase [Prevotellaceae bacterium]
MKNIMFRLIIIIIFVLASSYIYFKIKNILPDIFWVKLTYNLFFLLIVAAVSAGVFFREYLPLQINVIISNYSVTWIVACIYFMLIMLFISLINIMNKYFNFLPFNPYQIEIKRIIIFSTLALVVLILIWGRYNFNNIKIEKLDISINKSAKTETLKIVAASDLHLGYSIDKQYLKKIVDLINSRKPDMILLVGDIADAHSQPLVEQNMKEEFLQLQAPLGVYGVTGNHECYGDMKNTVDYLKSAGIIMLQDSSVLIDSDIYITGRNDKTVKNRKNLDELLQNIDKQKTIILLDHQPYNLNQAQENGIDLQISGHTHGGQIFPFTLITKLVYEKQHGYLRKNDTHYYITSGAGGWGPKLRTGSQSEIVEITLRFTR